MVKHNKVPLLEPSKKVKQSKALEVITGGEKLLYLPLRYFSEFCPEFNKLSEYERAKELCNCLMPLDKENKKWRDNPLIFRYLKKQLLMNKLIKTGKGNCVALACLYCAMARHLELDAKLANITIDYIGEEINHMCCALIDLEGRPRKSKKPVFADPTYFEFDVKHKKYDIPATDAETLFETFLEYLETSVKKKKFKESAELYGWMLRFSPEGDGEQLFASYESLSDIEKKIRLEEWKEGADNYYKNLFKNKKRLDREYNLALKYKGEGKYKKALKHFGWVINLFPKYKNVWEEIADIFQEANFLHLEEECREISKQIKNGGYVIYRLPKAFSAILNLYEFADKYLRIKDRHSKYIKRKHLEQSA